MIFAEYSLENSIGCGTYSTVYKIKDKQLAIKVYESFDHYTPNESHIMNLGIPGIPRLLDIVYDKLNDTFGIVMGLADCSLSDYISVLGKNTNSRKRHFIKTIARIISELHLKGFSHSDIKMDNILILNDEPYLIDFSLSSTFNSMDPNCIMSEDYQSPEIKYKNIELTTKVLQTADSWAFGCLCVLIYLGTKDWDKFSYSAFIEHLRDGGTLIELIDLNLEPEDIELLREIQQNHLNMNYEKREYLLFSIGYPVKNDIENKSQIVNPLNLSKPILKYFDILYRHNISKESANYGYLLFSKNLREFSKHKEVTKIKEWKNIFLYICLDISCVVYNADDAMSHKFFSKLSKTRFKDYKYLYTFFIIENRGYFEL